MGLLDEIASRPSVVELLDWPFDFQLDHQQEETDWIRLKPDTEFSVIATDGAGGVFLQIGHGKPESCPLVYASSEGQCGRIAGSLTEWLVILVAIPYWRDVLKFSNGGQLDEMRRAASHLEQDFVADFEGIEDARAQVVDSLRLTVIGDPVKVLHDNVRATDCVLITEEGQPWDPLFGNFRVSDNPHWRLES